MKKPNPGRTIILASCLLLQLSTLCFQSCGAAGDVDLSFDPGSGVNSAVNSVAVQPDGKVLIGGDFTTVKGLARAGTKLPRHVEVDALSPGRKRASAETFAAGIVSTIQIPVYAPTDCHDDSDFMLLRRAGPRSLEGSWRR